MDYEKMIKMLDGTSDAVDVTYIGKDSDGKWLYAKVSCGGYDEISADDFPVESTVTGQNIDGIDFMVSLTKPFDDEEDMQSAMEYCGMYTGN